MKIQDFTNSWIAKLNLHACEDSFRSVELILMKVLSLTREQLFLAYDQELSLTLQAQANMLLERRLLCEPMAYILGQKEFLGRSFEVSPSVLIPRPETEFLVELAIKELNARLKLFSEQVVVDVGTGSGIIGISTKLSLPQINVFALDESDNALVLAKRNAQILGADLTFFKSNLLSAILDPVDMILANLPYISEAEFNSLSPGVAQFEPKSALVSGDSGLELTLRLMDEAREKLKKDGIMICEIGATQAKKLSEEAKQRGFSFVELYNDLNMLPRVLVMCWSKPYGLG